MKPDTIRCDMIFREPIAVVDNVLVDRMRKIARDKRSDLVTPARGPDAASRLARLSSPSPDACHGSASALLQWPAIPLALRTDVLTVPSANNLAIGPGKAREKTVGFDLGWGSGRAGRSSCYDGFFISCPLPEPRASA